MITAKTESGFEIELDENLLNDSELMEDWLAAQENDAGAFFRLALRILGADGKKKLYDHLRKEDGRVPLDEFAFAIGQIMNSFQTGKNSSSSPT